LTGPSETQRGTSLAKLAIAAIIGLAWWTNTKEKSWPPGVLIAQTPTQTPNTTKSPWTMPDGTRITPLADYQIAARLLHRERYRWDLMADLSPVDFGVGWRQMSDQSVIDRISFSNSNRYLSWFTPDAAVLINDDCASNMHMIPANDAVRDRLLELDRGDLFQASGYLVCVERTACTPWTSSLTRTDSGNGACEIMWVTAIRPLAAPSPKP
jgi:hypothetical protein